MCGSWALANIVVSTTIDTTSNTGGGNTSFGILPRSAGDTGALAVNEGEGEALKAGCASKAHKLATNTLSEPAINACVLTRRARGAQCKGREPGTAGTWLVPDRSSQCRELQRTSGPEHPGHS